MADHAVSSDPAVQAQLDRLATLSPGADILGLERISRLLTALGDPHLVLPPQFHVAGTNGKGSTCAFLRTALEADGKSVHVFTSPHLVRFNERIRVNGALIDDATLARALERVLDVAGDISPSFFEVTTAAAFLTFAEQPADACIIEVGLGGRLDATNVLPAPAICGIAQIGLDHQSFLGNTERAIAAEKAGIAKAGVTLVSQKYEPDIASIIAKSVGQAGGRWLSMGSVWDAAVYRDRLHYRDEQGRIETPLPRLAGPHQPLNLALAIAMLRHQNAIEIGESAIKAAPLWATWPARLQRLESGPLVERIGGAERPIWLDGGHNSGAGAVLGAYFETERLQGQKLDILIGMLANKDVAGFLAPLKDSIGHIHSVAVPGHESHGSEQFAALATQWSIGCTAHGSLEQAVDALRTTDNPVLICGSLYLAGEVLRLNEQLPD
ncbi:MAG: folylpolyglutamate synthase/dihydrofolate synthase family protein [Sphingobium sp.]